MPRYRDSKKTKPAVQHERSRRPLSSQYPFFYQETPSFSPTSSRYPHQSNPYSMSPYDYSVSGYNSLRDYWSFQDYARRFDMPPDPRDPFNSHVGPTSMHYNMHSGYFPPNMYYPVAVPPPPPPPLPPQVPSPSQVPPSFASPQPSLQVSSLSPQLPSPPPQLSSPPPQLSSPPPQLSSPPPQAPLTSLSLLDVPLPPPQAPLTSSPLLEVPLPPPQAPLTPPPQAPLTSSPLLEVPSPPPQDSSPPSQDPSPSLSPPPQDPSPSLTPPPQLPAPILAPQVQTAMRPPQVQSAMLPSQVQSAMRPPQVQSAMRPPQVQSAMRPPQVQSAMRPRQVQSAMRPRQVQSAMRPPRVPSGIFPPHLEAMIAAVVPASMMRQAAQSPGRRSNVLLHAYVTHLQRALGIAEPIRNANPAPLHFYVNTNENQEVIVTPGAGSSNDASGPNILSEVMNDPMYTDLLGRKKHVDRLTNSMAIRTPIPQEDSNQMQDLMKLAIVWLNKFMQNLSSQTTPQSGSRPGPSGQQNREMRE